jgi:ankyrin repeat protein
LKLGRYLIDSGAEVNASDKYGQTALMHAAQKRHLEFAKLLIDSGADMNAKTREQEIGAQTIHCIGEGRFLLHNWTALMFAAATGDAEFLISFAQMLLAKKPRATG